MIQIRQLIEDVFEKRQDVCDECKVIADEVIDYGETLGICTHKVLYQCPKCKKVFTNR